MTFILRDLARAQPSQRALRELPGARGSLPARVSPRRRVRIIRRAHSHSPDPYSYTAWSVNDSFWHHTSICFCYPAPSSHFLSCRSLTPSLRTTPRIKLLICVNWSSCSLSRLERIAAGASANRSLVPKLTSERVSEHGKLLTSRRRKYGITVRLQSDFHIRPCLPGCNAAALKLNGGIQFIPIPCYRCVISFPRYRQLCRADSASREHPHLSPTHL